MNQPSVADLEHQHWAIRELLPRYADLKRLGRNVEIMYPEVAAHLKRCTACQALLVKILHPGFAPPDKSHRIAAAALPFIKEPVSVSPVQVTPGSDSAKFRIRVTLSLVDTLTGAASGARWPEQPPRAVGPIQPSGRVLLRDAIALEDGKVRVILMLETSDLPDRYRVVGKLVSERLPPVVNARLYVGDSAYFSAAYNGRLCFNGIPLEHDAQAVRLTLETPE